MPYITERWPGGRLTNFVTIRKAVKKMSAIDRSKQDGTFNVYEKAFNANADEVQLTKFEHHPVRFLSAANDNTLAFIYDGGL